MAPSARRRTPPTVTLSGSALADSPLLTDGSLDAVAVPVAPGREGDEGLAAGSGTAQAAARYGIDLAELAERSGLTGAAGESSVVQLPRPVGSAVALPWTDLPPRIVLVGVGQGSDTDLRRAGAALARASRGWRAVATTLGDDDHAASSDVARRTRALVEGYLLAAYAQPSGAHKDTAKAAAELVLLGRDGGRVGAAVVAARTAASATWLVRDLANTPSGVKNPAWVADQARRLATRAGVSVEVLGPRELAAQGFGGILAVGGGSASTPRLVVARYTPPQPAAHHVVVVGKGITYDTGGLSIKPRESMVPMKTDMAGAAVALATVLGAAHSGSVHRVTAVLPLAENQVGAASYRPDDVVRLYGGTTVEVQNTDAEGRMVLADALAYADAVLDPDVLIDVATLTGAATLGLGRGHAALYGTDDDLVRALTAAGQATGELAWPMPLSAEYQDSLRSDVADVRQTARDKHMGGGSVFAALFLQRFVGTRRWAHLDVAGTARATADAHEVTAGATGYGARLLLQYLADLS
ncbi:Cytosol aminopeptidase [Cellulomonas sp. T2.31MG-18]|uniref:leucyl aminopeptidase family protein n=1 Tax=Cellulomonas sp. T2.31MG-18 TaxID=3157619 RepID=UPI0035EC4B96